MHKNILLCVGITILFLGLSITPSIAIDTVKKASIPISNGNTLYVGGSGPGNYTKIQDAINDSSDGDTVYVYDDSSPYVENIIINKSISLVGEDKNTTIIDGNESGEVVSIVSDWVNISGFTIQNGGYGYDGIKIFSEYITITGSIISGNQDGIRFCSSYGSNIIDNIIWNNNWAGIYLGSSYNNIITNNSICNNDDGICLSFSDGNNIIHNNFSNNSWYGIFLSQSSDNNIMGNSILNEYYASISLYYSSVNNIRGNTMMGGGILIIGNRLKHWNSYVIDTSNTVNGKPVIYWKNQFGGIIPTGAGQVILANCNDVLVENQNLSSCFAGIELGYSSNCTIIGNNASNNDYGIYLYYSNGNNLTGNTASNNRYGINLGNSCINNIITFNNILNSRYSFHLYYSNNNTIKGNNITNNRWGIQLSTSSSNIIMDNTISNNDWGVTIFHSSDNNFIGNTASNNRYCIRLDESSNNTIYHNSFINNIQNAYNEEGNNIWDDGKYGNYWSDYEEKYPDAKKKPFKGIWDTPYNINGGSNKDKCPLIKQWPKTRTRTIIRDTEPFNSLFRWFLERFPMLERLLSVVR